MTVGSLFAGIGGFDLGLERAGMTVKWQVEIDPFCLAVLAKHWPDVQRFEDVRTVGAHNLPPVDLFCGGFPCQDISSAGLRAGIDGSRSGLWSEFARLIGEIRPRYVIVENVAALLTFGMGRVLGDLASCGYDAQWDCLPASSIGAHHRRDRVWIVAHAERAGSPQSEQNLSLNDERELSGWTQVPADAVGCDSARVVDSSDANNSGSLLGANDRETSPGTDKPSRNDAAGFRPAVADSDFIDGRWGPMRPGWREWSAESLAEDRQRHRSAPDGIWATEPNVGRVAHGIPARVDRLRGLGNAIVPQIAEWIGRQIMNAERVA